MELVADHRDSDLHDLRPGLAEPTSPERTGTVDAMTRAVRSAAPGEHDVIVDVAAWHQEAVWPVG